MITGLPPTVSPWAGLETPTATRPGKGVEGVGETGSSTDFGGALQSAVKAVEGHQAAADDAAFKVASGQNQNYHEMMIALEEANISLRAMGSVRDKFVEAYQAIWNMPV
jgi:flagellar hook-basal body complex protein FliE